MTNKPSNRVPLIILAALLPLIGFIVGIVHLGKSKEYDRQTGLWCLIVSILAFVFWAGVFN